ncbi:MAG: hypothetical protein K1X64_19295 [Myxococcaceae bacterium]|nr:hypothetical protein [Myxococcaceae bacterium]
MLLALWVCSLVLSLAVPMLTRSPTADLSGLHTDHLRHAHAAWVFLHRGFDVYRLPFGEAVKGVPFAHPYPAWEHVPSANPVGTFLFFLPAAAIGQWVPMSDATYARLGICLLVIVAHLALLAMGRALGKPGWAELLVLITAWLLLLRAALQGFYDPAWLGCTAMALAALRSKRPAAALLWVCAAALLNYRAVVAAPLGALAAWELFQQARASHQRPPWPLFAAAAVATLTVTTFVWVLPYASAFSQMPPLLFSHDDAGIAVVLGLSIAVAAWCAYGADRLVVATVLVTCALALIDPRYWWHGSVLLVAPLAVGAYRPAARPALCWVALVAWVWLVQKTVWGGMPNSLFRELASALQS